MYKKVYFILIIMSFFSILLAGPMVRIGLLEYKGAVVIYGKLLFMASYDKGKIYGKFKKAYVQVYPFGNFVKVKVGKKSFIDKGFIFIDYKGFVQINRRKYRGQIIVKAKKNRLIVINRLDIEDYLKGVLPLEMGASFPLEALKAQAVIARTYALSHIARHSRDGFDLCDTQHCQVYGGVNVEKSITNKAVKQTKGVVLKYKGKYINAVYSASCGGMTATADEVWGKKLPYFTVKKDPYCLKYKASYWKTSFTDKALAKTMKSYGLNIGDRVKDIKIISRTKSGRVKYLKIIGNKDSVTVYISDFRKFIGYSKVLSRLFSIDKKKYRRYVKTDSTDYLGNLIQKKVNAGGGTLFILNGKGFGHGVGLCQWGAYGMAKKGKNWRQILRFYYKSVVLKKEY